MPEHIQYEDDDLFNPETHREESDVPVRPLWWALALFVVFAAITHIVLYFMYHAMMNAEEKRMEPPQTTIARPRNANIPQNQPRLQPFPYIDTTDTTASMATPYEHTPVTDLIEMRAAEKQVLDHYGWVDKQHGVVHIPIEQAKEMMAARMATQTQTAPVAPVATPTTAATTTAATTTEGAH